jgi:hypothetical protein
MNNSRWAAVIAVSIAAVAGCAPVAPLVIEQPIGPYEPPVPAANLGTLVVYSDTEYASADREYPVHTPYTVLTPEGQVVREVENRLGAVDKEPTPVALPAGRYRVVARDDQYGRIDLLAVVEAGRKTVVDLNEDFLPPRTTRGDQWVRLPSGQIIGTRSPE